MCQVLAGMLSPSAKTLTVNANALETILIAFTWSKGHKGQGSSNQDIQLHIFIFVPDVPEGFEQECAEELFDTLQERLHIREGKR